MLSDHEAWLVERLSRVAPSLRARRMFGGVGLYSQDVFFALIVTDILYLKVDDESRPEYEGRGMGPFQPFADKPSMRGYFELPPDALDDARRLRPWVEAAVRAARSARATPRKRTTKAPRPRKRAVD
jgi:DNA transformation protein